MSREFACKQCSHIGTPRGYKKMRGNLVMSTILWTFIVPGVFYSIWRRMGPAGHCEKCGGNAFASLRSSHGKMAMEEAFTKEFARNATSNKSLQ